MVASPVVGVVSFAQPVRVAAARVAARARAPIFKARLDAIFNLFLQFRTGW